MIKNRYSIQVCGGYYRVFDNRENRAINEIEAQKLLCHFQESISLPMNPALLEVFRAATVFRANTGMHGLHYSWEDACNEVCEGFEHILGFHPYDKGI